MMMGRERGVDAFGLVLCRFSLEFSVLLLALLSHTSLILEPICD